MCFGGGGGGAPAPDTSATDKMLAEEKKRREEEERKRKEAVTAVNTIYGLTPTGADLPKASVNDAYAVARKNATKRQVAYNTARQNQLALAMEGLNRAKVDNQRNLRFGLARQGLAGGSVDLDEMSKLSDAFGRGVIQANRAADSLVGSIRADDERTRAELISRINAGMGADSAASLAANRMKANYAEKIYQPPTNLDGVFNGVSSFWGGYQRGLGEREGREYQPKVGAVGSYKGRIS